MLIAGEPSGDLLAAELVSALRAGPERSGDGRALRFFGAGGAKMSAAGVELAFDLTQHAVVGITDVLKNYFKFRGMFDQLLALAIERRPDMVIGVDYSGFNLRFGHAVREYARYDSGDWRPKIAQFVSPQVWASRPGRADLLARDYDLLLCIFPFEKEWYARRAPKLRVEFVGHPMMDRFAGRRDNEAPIEKTPGAPLVLLLPGSRRAELQRHLPVILPAWKAIRAKFPEARPEMVLPDENLARLARSLGAETRIQIGNLPDALAQADLAIASTGTVTMECAFFGVPTVTLYKTSWLTYEIGRRIVTVNSLTMPNLLAGEELYPEFIQSAATPENIAAAAVELLQDDLLRRRIKARLRQITATLGGPGAARRAAAAILSLCP